MQELEHVNLHDRRRRRVLANSQTGTFIGLLVAAALVSSIFYLGGDPAAPPDESFFPGQIPGPETSHGQELFATTCAPCHGVTAGGNEGAGIPALNSAGSLWQLTEREILTVILEGTPLMPGNADLLDEEQALEIIDFLKTLWTEEQRSAYEASNQRETP
ncbi:MAG TPA: c-type cytochrome [Anaerolineales bacterium]|nr:c-type cytochrome [Anaerolineales bacterium]